MYTNGTTTISGKKIVVNGRVILNPTKEQLQEAGWTEVVPPTPTEEELAQQQREMRIEELHKLLEGTDYRVIKNSEYSMLGLPLPYDPQEIHREKQAWRDELNELEVLLQ